MNISELEVWEIKQDWFKTKLSELQKQLLSRITNMEEHNSKVWWWLVLWDIAIWVDDIYIPRRYINIYKLIYKYDWLVQKHINIWDEINEEWFEKQFNYINK